MTEWFADDEFWRDANELMFGEEHFLRAEQDTDRVLALAGTTPRDVLDLCCGPGRYTIPLARRGFSVTGVDLSPYLLDRARARAREAHVSPAFVQADMRAFVQPQAFDLIVNLHTSFGYFADRLDDDRVLRNMVASLRPGGRVIIDVVGKELVARRGDRVSTLADGATVAQHIDVSDDWETLTSEWFIVRGNAARRFAFTHRLYSGFELRRAMEAVGLAVSLFGSVQGTPYNARAERLIAVGRKA